MDYMQWRIIKNKSMVAMVNETISLWVFGHVSEHHVHVYVKFKEHLEMRTIAMVTMLSSCG